MVEKLKWLATRSRAVMRAGRVLGFQTTMQLVLMRMENRKDKMYQLRIRSLSHPVTLRGGRTSDAWALYEIMVMKEYALRPEEWQTRVRTGGEDQPGSVEAFTVSTLLAYGDGHIDLLKMDVEGSEKEIFGAEAQNWLPSIRNIAIELHSKECVDRFFGALRGYEYELHEHRYVAFCRNLCAPAALACATPVEG